MVSELQSFDLYFFILIGVDIRSGAWDKVFSSFHAQYTLREKQKREGMGREGGRKEGRKEGREEGRNSSVGVEQRNYIAVSSYQFLSKVYLAGDFV